MLATAHRSLARCVWNFSCFTCRTREREKEEKSAMRCWINTPLKLQHALYLLVKRDPSIMPSTLSLSLVRAPEYTRSNCRCDLFSAMRFLERRKCYYIFSSFLFPCVYAIDWPQRVIWTCTRDARRACPICADATTRRGADGSSWRSPARATSSSSKVMADRVFCSPSWLTSY